MKSRVSIERVKKKFPGLGKLSIAIIAGQIEKLLGGSVADEFMGTYELLEEEKKLAGIFEKTEKDFQAECENEEMRAGLLNLSGFSDLPSLYDAFLKYVEFPGDPDLKNKLRSLMKRDFPVFTGEEIAAGVEQYMDILKRNLVALSSEVREKISTNELIGIRQQLEKLNQASPHKNLHGLYPENPPLLIGRQKDIEEIKKKLGMRGGSQKDIRPIVSVRGWPGVGKTTLISAIAYDDEVAKVFPDGVLFTSLGEKPDISAELARWQRAMGAEVQQEQVDVEEARTSLAARLKDSRMLLLIDDVWQSEHATPFLIGGAGCAILITTRLLEIASSISPTQALIYRLPVLDEEASLKLLTHIAPDVVEKYPEDARLLVSELEGLPLALVVAGKLLSEEASFGLSVQQLIKDIHTSARLLDEHAPANRADFVKQTTPTVAALLEKSTDHLDARTKKCYALLGLLAPKPATFDLKMMGIFWQMEDPAPTARILLKRGLIEYLPDIDRYQMHALLVAHAQTLFQE